MQKILVTGGLGFIGSNLTRMLLDKNYYVINIDKNLDIAEQFDPINCNQLSAKKLTWNYVELYMTNLLLKKN